MRQCGYSDKMFYYNGSGEQTYSMRLRYEFSISLTREMVEEAVQRTFALFPDYRVRPVLRDGRVFYEENPLPVPVFWNESGHVGHCYGSDEVNGYLFVISAEEHALTYSQYHGLTDFVGFWSIIRTLMGNLMARVGIHAQDPLARVDSAPYDSLDRCEREDPYSKYAHAHAQSAWSYHSRGALTLAPKGEPRERFFDLSVPEEDFLAKSREYGTSFVPLLAMVFAWAVHDVCPIGETPVVVKVPVDLRRLFHSRTTVNFSDSVVLEFPREYLSRSRAEQGKALREMLDQQLDAGNFAQVMAKKIRTIESYEHSGQSIGEISRSLMGSASTSSRPVTLGLTYLGKQRFPEAYQALITDIVPCAYTPTDGVFALVLAYGGRLKLRIQVRYEHEDFIDALAKELRGLGMEVERSQAELDLRDYMDVSRLKQASEGCAASENREERAAGG